MTWYGGNDGGMLERKKVGDLIRYGDGPSALMRITYVREMGDRGRGISTEVRYYGRCFHDTISYYDTRAERASAGRYHGQCYEPTEADVQRWKEAHDENDDWIRGKW